MKHLKKFMSILLTAIMVLAMCVPVMAADGDSTTVKTECTLKAPDKGTGAEHTYELYQIFTGKLHIDGSKKVLTDIKWGRNAKNGTEGEKVDDSIIQALENVDTSATDEAKLAIIQQYVDLNGSAYGEIKSGESKKVPTGYYLIKDKDNTLQGKDGAYTKYVVSVVSDMTFEVKTSVPTVVKKLKETNDTTGVTTDWQDGADYDIGDNVPFQLTGTLPSDYDKYTKYKYVFHDTISAGLTYNGDAKVYVVNGTDKTEVTTSFTINDLSNIACDNLKTITEVTITSASKIVVVYTAKLNENANKGKLGNENEVYLEYANNPNFTGDGDQPTGNTPKDTVIVFTYILEANKVDENKKPLTGAGFTLYKIVNNTEKKIDEEIKGTDLTTFTWTGLDAGKYILKETTVPSQYNKANDIEFEIVGEYTGDLGATGDAPELTGLSVKDKDGNIISGNLTTGATFTAVKESGTVSTSIVNKKGSQLPETGGIGTTIFYVVGVVLMLGAGVLLITKRRMSAKH